MTNWLLVVVPINIELQYIMRGQIYSCVRISVWINGTARETRYYLIIIIYAGHERRESYVVSTFDDWTSGIFMLYDRIIICFTSVRLRVQYVVYGMRIYAYYLNFRDNKRSSVHVSPSAGAGNEFRPTFYEPIAVAII